MEYPTYESPVSSCVHYLESLIARGLIPKRELPRAVDPSEIPALMRAEEPGQKIAHDPLRILCALQLLDRYRKRRHQGAFKAVESITGLYHRTLRYHFYKGPSHRAVLRQRAGIVEGRAS